MKVASSPVEDPSESVVLCEGFYDRAFWAGWLSYLGCEDPGIQPGKKNRVTVYDPWNRPVAGKGEFGFRSPGEGFIRVLPCFGKENVLREADSRLKRREDHRLSRLVINADNDLLAGSAGEGAGPNQRNVSALVSALDPLGESSAENQWTLGDTEVHLLKWETPDPASPTLPDQQCLERLVCAALVSAFPNRGPAVEQWLRSRPQAADATPKSHVWSHMAGWYADHGCEDFLRRIWDDKRIVAELELRLRETGAWAVAEALVREAEKVES